MSSTEVRPQDDLYQAVNQEWLEQNQIPDEYTSWNNFTVLYDQSLTNLKTMVEALKDQDDLPHQQDLLKGLYFSGMDLEQIEKDGTHYLNALFDRVNKVTDLSQLSDLAGELTRQGLGSVFSVAASQDSKNSEFVVPHVFQSGLSLPDRDYYFSEDKQELVEKFKQHVSRMLQLAGVEEEQADQDAEIILALEKRLAEHHQTKVERRNPDNVYHKFSYPELKTQCRNFNFDVYFSSLGFTLKDREDAYLIVDNPKYLNQLSSLLEDIELSDWLLYYRWRVLTALASYLPARFDDENFDFFSRTLSGQKVQKPRWKRMLSLLDSTVGEALGELYVSKYFPETSKQAMLHLVDNLMASMRDRINALDWMCDETKSRALEKLDTMTRKIGYPDKWIDYSSLDFDEDMSYLGRVLACSVFENARDQDKWYKPVDRSEWHMTPQTINAYYSPEMNEIVFPAGILQPPFFDPMAPEAHNYGGIGAVIGHEITHAFDDSGRKYDAKGNLADWWTDEDAKKFTEKANVIVEQYNDLKVYDKNVNGELTLGENIADIGGLRVSYYAMLKAGQTSKEAAQIFFNTWAQGWRGLMTKEAALQRLVVDPHAPQMYRVNTAVSNLEEFRQAFDVKEGDGMYNQRALSIW